MHIVHIPVRYYTRFRRPALHLVIKSASVRDRSMVDSNSLTTVWSSFVAVHFLFVVHLRPSGQSVSNERSPNATEAFRQLLEDPESSKLNNGI